jgi:hypothetical protein
MGTIGRGSAVRNHLEGGVSIREPWGEGRKEQPMGTIGRGS